MVQYLLLIHGSTQSDPTSEEWESFFEVARQSGIFRGGSELGDREIIGDHQGAKPSDHIVGFMRFDSEDKDQVLAVLKLHPIVVHGGCVELCAMPES